MQANQLALVGLLFLGAVVAQDNLDAAVFNSNFYEPESANEALPYWWMSKGSPFKRSYETAQSQPIQQRIDFANNPFLSGRPFVAADSEPAAAENVFSRAGSFRGPGYLPPTNDIPQTVPCNGNDRVCVPRYQCVGGQVDANQLSGSNSQECHPQNEVCCSVRRTPPPPPPQPPTRPPPPPPTQPPTRPPPPPTQPPTRPPPPPPPQPQPQQCGPNSGCVPQTQCYNGVVSGPAGYQPQASSCFAPNVCCRYPPQPVPDNSHDDIVTQRPRPPPTPSEVLTSEGYVITVPAATTARPIVTRPPTQRPYVTPAVQTQRPTIATPPPYKGDEYIPPRDNEIPEPSNPNHNYLPPNRGEDEKPEQIPDHSNDNPSVVVPVGPTAPPPLPPIQCPAATNCTEIQYCTSEGTISKTPVILTKDQETFRVPLSDCRNVQKGFTGKCCRDLDYTDPWPVSILGQYNATILGFDDGSYKPSPGDAPSGRLTQGPSRGQGQLSLPIPGAAATQQTFIRTPFPQGVNSQYTKSAYNPEPNSISQRDKPATNKYQPNYQSNPLQQHNYQPSPQQQFQQPQYPRKSSQPQQSHEQQQQYEPQPQQPITHHHVQRQIEPAVSSYQPEQPAFLQPIVAQEHVSQRQTPFGQRYTNPSNGVCVTRDTNTVPRGQGPIDAGFGEFPWQAMILKESTKTLICGGAIVDGDVVATAAHCVQGIRATDILIKGGEWKLGSDEEPLPFQLIRVKSITMHPAYQPTNLQSDIALLHLENKLNFDKHIGPVCLDENDVEPKVGEECVTSGWGKEVLKHHYANALPHAMPITPLSEAECQGKLAHKGFDPSVAICGKPQFDACDVDIGSALVCTRGDGKYLMKGLYSTETACGTSPSQLITFTKMDVPWIKSRGTGPPSSSRLLSQQSSYLPPQ